jgi:hypothetical protein
VATADHGLCVLPRSTEDGLYTSEKLVLVKGLREIVIGSEPEALHFILNVSQAREDQNGCPDPVYPKQSKNLITGNVREVEVQDDQPVLFTRPRLTPSSPRCVVST